MVDRIDHDVWEKSTLGVFGPSNWSAYLDPAREVYYKSLLDLHANAARKVGSASLSVLKGRTAIQAHPMFARSGAIATSPRTDLDAHWLGVGVPLALAFAKPRSSEERRVYELFLGVQPNRPVAPIDFFDVCARLGVEIVRAGGVGLVAQMDKTQPASMQAEIRTRFALAGFKRLTEAQMTRLQQA